jgi:DnaJ-class molecular chaperone
MSDNHFTTCPLCLGSGKSKNIPHEMTHICTPCRGTGKVLKGHAEVLQKHQVTHINR